MSEQRKKILQMLAEGKITVDEAERLLCALSGKQDEEAGPALAADKKPKYLRVLVQGGPKGENVNIRVPLALIRAGIKLKSVLPDHAKDKLGAALKNKGINIDLDKAAPETVEEIISGISGLSVDVDGGDEQVRIFCE